MSAIRQPVVAGQFHAKDAGELATTVAMLPDAAPAAGGPAPGAFIVPRAGDICPGPIAATACAPLRPHRDHYRRGVLLGLCHRVPLRGLAPAGDVHVEQAPVAGLDVPGLVVADGAYAPGHSLEVQTPGLRNSGDAHGDTMAAVGYGARSFLE